MYMHTCNQSNLCKICPCVWLTQCMHSLICMHPGAQLIRALCVAQLRVCLRPRTLYLVPCTVCPQVRV